MTRAVADHLMYWIAAIVAIALWLGAVPAADVVSTAIREADAHQAQAQANWEAEKARELRLAAEREAAPNGHRTRKDVQLAERVKP